MKQIFILTLAGAFLLSACGATGDIEVHSAWARPTAQGENAAVYFTIHNHAETGDELISATSTVADVAEIHESKMENDVMQMNMFTSLPIAADQEIIFMPGGLHIMLVDVKDELILGERIGLILHFKNHEDVVVEVHIEHSQLEENHKTDPDQ